MNIDDAYYLVFKDLTKEDGLLTGKFDGENGNVPFMYGIQTVMGLIAYKCGNDCFIDFDNRFMHNMIESHIKEEIDTHLTEVWDKESSDCDLWQKDRTCIGCYRYDICKQAEQRLNKTNP